MQCVPLLQGQGIQVRPPHRVERDWTSELKESFPPGVLNRQEPTETLTNPLAISSGPRKRKESDLHNTESPSTSAQ